MKIKPKLFLGLLVIFLTLGLAVEVKAAVRVTWLGTSGLHVTDGKSQILIDPFVSRPGFLTVALGVKLQPNQEEIERWRAKLKLEGLDAVLVSHSHYDHVMDLPYLMEGSSAVVYGSPSTRYIALGGGVSESQIQVVNHRDIHQVGKFRITFRESEHGAVFLGKPMYHGYLSKILPLPAKASDFRTGRTYSILIEHPLGSFLHHASANWREDTLEGVKADVVFIGLAARSDTEAYLKAVVDQVGAKKIYPFHWDDFFKPLSEGISVMGASKLKEFIEAATNHRPQVEMEFLGLGASKKLF